MVPSSPKKSVCSGSSGAVLRGEDCRHLGFGFGVFWILVLHNKRRKGDQSLPFLFLSNSPAYVLPKWSPETSTCPWRPGSQSLSTGVTGPKQTVGTGGRLPAGQWANLAAPLPYEKWRAVQLVT